MSDPQVEAELRTNTGRSIFGELETCRHLQTLYGGELYYQGVLQETKQVNADERHISETDKLKKSRIKVAFDSNHQPKSHSKISKVVSKRSRLFH
jgi:hypothetical protein